MTGENLKYLLAILNSKVAEWYFNQISTSSGMGTNMWKKYKIEQLPIKNISKEQQKPFEILVDYILWLKSNENVLTETSDKIMAGYFEQMINGLVYELYFEEAMKASQQDILQYLIDLPALEKGKELAQMRAFFKEYHHPEHPVRVRLYYMDSVQEIRIIKGKHVH